MAGETVKDNVIALFESGDIEKMVEWAKANQTEFYQLYAELMEPEGIVLRAESARGK